MRHRCVDWRGWLTDMADFALALACFVLLMAWKAPLLAVIGGSALSLAA